MALSIKHPEADRLARELATVAVLNALRERLGRVPRRVPAESLAEQLRAIGERCARLPVVDARTPKQILNYDDRGLPG